MAPRPPPPPKSPFLVPRRWSSYGGGGSDHSSSPHVATTDPSGEFNPVEPEHKSSLLGCTANLITAIVGAGIIGMPYAMRETGLVAGWALMFLSAVLGCKSLRLLVETAKHVDATSYETLCETAFGQVGWVLCNVMMFMMAWGPMLSYQMIVKDTLGNLLGYPGHYCLIISSLAIMLPLSLQRDMADLAKTSRISVLFNIGLVGIIAKFSPTSESISEAGGIGSIISQSTVRPGTLAIGLGVISFAFSCQHSSLIIAGSLENPTRERWSKASWAALGFCTVLSLVMGSYGYVGFLEETEGNILKNFPMPYEVNSPNDIAAAKAANIARGFVCGTMFFVYPLESFVARHVIMTNLFQGREAHEGDDHAVLDRWDRRVATTIVLYLSVLIPALRYEDVGLVLAWTGSVAASSLTYIGPGLLFMGIHGREFIELVQSIWGENPSFFGQALWYFLAMPLWCHIAKTGDRTLSLHMMRKELMTPAVIYRLGKVKHNRDRFKKHRQMRSHDDLLGDAAHEPESRALVQHAIELGLATASSDISKSYGSASPNRVQSSKPNHDLEEANCEEEDPQDEKQTASDFAVAVFLVFFGIIALTAGILSIFANS